MLSYFLKNKKRAEIQNLMVAKTKNKNQWFFKMGSMCHWKVKIYQRARSKKVSAGASDKSC